MTQLNLPEEFLEISGSIDLSKYISDVLVSPETSELVASAINLKSTDLVAPQDRPAQPQTRKDLEEWIARKREGSRSGITITLIVFFGVSLLAEFLLIGLGAFYHQANTALIKDTLPLLINSLTSILSLALAFYFRDK